MARPAKYEWERVELYYRGGATRDEIVNKFNVPRNKLAEKIKIWGSVSDTAGSVHRGLAEVSDKINELSGTDPKLMEATMEIAQSRNPRFKKIIEDMTLANMANLGKKIRNGEISTPQDNKHTQDAIDKAAVTLGVADRHAPKSDVNIQNNQLNSTSIQVDFVDP